jgi:TPR repeat protein
LGRFYRQAASEETNYAKAVQWFEKAAEKGILAAQLELAEMRIEGQGFARDPGAGLATIKGLAQQGYEWAQLYLGRAYILV